MLALALLIIAAICFLLAAVNESIFDQGPADLVAWGLFSFILSQIVAGGLVIYEKRVSN